MYIGKFIELNGLMRNRPLIVEQGLSLFLDRARWIAALAVCVAHLRNLLFPDAYSVEQLGVFAQAFYLISLFGTQAVVVFFVISGFLIGAHTLKKVYDRDFSIIRYSIDRIVRLYLVLIPACVVTLILQWFHFGVTCVVYDKPADIIVNLLLLQNLIAEPLCNNHPLWSLSNEGIYYLFWPAFCFVVVGSNFRRSAAVVIVFAFVALFNFYKDIGSNFLFGSPESVIYGAILWSFGLLPLFLKIKFNFLNGLILLILLMFLSRLHVFESRYLEDLFLALAFSLTICSRFPTVSLISYNSSYSRKWASYAYSLYLLHMPIAQAIATVVGPQSLNPHYISSYVVFNVALGLILVAAYYFGQMFESRTTWVRMLVTRTLFN